MRPVYALAGGALFAFGYWLDAGEAEAAVLADLTFRYFGDED